MKSNPRQFALLIAVLFLLLTISCSKDPDPLPEYEKIHYITVSLIDEASGAPIRGGVSFWRELEGSGIYTFEITSNTNANGQIHHQWNNSGINVTSLRLYVTAYNYSADTLEIAKPLGDTSVTISLKEISKSRLGYNGTVWVPSDQARIVNGQLVIGGFLLADSVAVGVYPLGIGQYNALSSVDAYDCIDWGLSTYCLYHSYYSGFASQNGTAGKVEITRINWQDSVVWGRFEGVSGLQNDASQLLTYNDGKFDSISFTFVSGKAGEPRPYFNYEDWQGREVKHRNITAVRNDTALIVSTYNYGEGLHFTLPLTIQPGIYTAGSLSLSIPSSLGWLTPTSLDPEDLITISEVDMVNHRLKGTFNLDLSWNNNYVFRDGGFQVRWE